MCRDHWFAVAPEIRRRVWATSRDRHAGVVGAEKRHFAAVCEAIEYVSELAA